jgi:predicted NUDIX family phosphoesterase
MGSLASLFGGQDRGPSPAEIQAEQEKQRRMEAIGLQNRQRRNASRVGVGSLVNLNPGLTIPGDNT